MTVADVQLRKVGIGFALVHDWLHVWLDTEMSGARDDCCKIRLYFLAKSNYSYRYNLLNSGDQWLVKITIPIYL